MFNTTFFDSITQDEHTLLSALLNADKSVLFELQHANAVRLMNKLATVNLTEEGHALRLSIFDKYKNATCIIDNEEVFIEDEKPCSN
jgi:hypothetical protein